MNLPNRMSLFRLILIPIIVAIWVFPYSQFGIEIPKIYISYICLPLNNVICLALFITASVTDFLDGYIARSTNQITVFGKFIDPIADKGLTTTMFILFVANGIIPVVPVIIMIWRDIVVDGIRLIAASNDKIIAAGIFGKIKTVSQMICIILILLNNIPFEFIGIPAADIMLWFATIISVIGGIDYFKQAKEIIFQSK